VNAGIAVKSSAMSSEDKYDTLEKIGMFGQPKYNKYRQ
jgi:hypothetical protein